MWQLKTVVSLHWFLICVVPLQLKLKLPTKLIKQCIKNVQLDLPWFGKEGIKVYLCFAMFLRKLRLHFESYNFFRKWEVTKIS
jgi:hypothetical protein